jgi:Putative addiction module component
MARAVAEIEREVPALQRGDQEQLLRALLEELDGPADSNVEQAWIEEAQRRS